MTKILERSDEYQAETPDQQRQRIEAAVAGAAEFAVVDPLRQKVGADVAALVGEPMLYGGVSAMRASHLAEDAARLDRVRHHS